MSGRMTRATFVAGGLALTLLFAQAGVRAADGALTFPIGRLTQEMSGPTIDGRVDEEVWRLVEPYGTFTQQDPIEGAPATERTEVRVLIDRSTLYVGIICFDSEPDKIVISQGRRDAELTESDAVLVVLDTFNDSQNGFVFGTNPVGIEYDGQVSGEGQTSGLTQRQAGAQGSQRGQISAFNANWDGDWRVRAQVTERGWEAEMAIPLKTLRYATGSDRTWGFNVKRNIRRKNEQVFLAPIPRGFDIYRVSGAAKLTGLDLPPRRDLKAIPFMLGSANKDYTLSGDQLDRRADVGLDVKWGVRPNLTADFTVNTDFAQVEADEEQVNLTRFDLFFPEKRPFFLENASIFQFGAPQSVDLFFSRRIGLSGLGASGLPIGIIGGARLTGKLGGYNVGLLDMQTERTEDRRTRALIAPANNFAVARIQRELGRSNFGAIFVNRQAGGETGSSGRYNRAYGVDANWQVSRNGRVFAFIARTESPGDVGSDHAGRVFYNFTNNLWNVSGGYSQVGDRFNPEVGFLPRRGYRRPEMRIFFQPQPKRWPWIRRISPHTSHSAYYSLDGGLQSSQSHFHFFEIQPARGGRFGTFVDRSRDRPEKPFTVYDLSGRRVMIPPGLYTWYQFVPEFISDPSAPIHGSIRYRRGGFYDGDLQAIELDAGVRSGARFAGTLGWTRQRIELPGGAFTTDLIPVKVSVSFTPRASLQALVQYNSQAALLSSNVRLALLNRSGTGLFVVYNDRRDTSTFNPYDVLGRSFILKYTRLFDF